MAALSLGTLFLPGAAEAAAICSLLGPQAQIIMDPTSNVVSRSGDDILVDGASCGTVHNVGEVHFDDNGDNHDRQSATISLAGGSFAPGLDLGPTPEIDFTYHASGVVCDPVRIVGTILPEHITLGTTTGAQMANLNADELDGVDPDLWTTGGCIHARVYGLGGRDVLVGAGGVGTGDPDAYLLWLSGGDGADILSGGASKDTILGGAGPDVIRRRTVRRLSAQRWLGQRPSPGQRGGRPASGG
jgi:hypothetical protein